MGRTTHAWSAGPSFPGAGAEEDRSTQKDPAAQAPEETASGTISAQDRIEISEILSFSSHLLDNRQWDMFGEVFVPEVERVTPRGGFTGTAGVRRHLELIDLSRFPATHTLNTIVEAVEEDTAVAWSRMLLLT